MKIVVRAPNWIGDSILSVPAIESLSKNFPNAEIWILGRTWAADLFPSYEFIKGVIPIPEKNDLATLRKTAHGLKNHHFDTGLLLTNSFASAFLFSLAKLPQRWGYANEGRQLLLTKAVKEKKRKKSSHQVQYYLNLLSGLGLKTYPAQLSFPLTEEDRVQAKRFLFSNNIDLKKCLIIITPGAFYGSAKRWTISQFAALAAKLQKECEAEILITGSAAEIDLANCMASLLKVKPHILAGKTSLRQLAGIISHSTLCVMNDSGPMHLANALKIPTVSLFGPTDPSVTGPYQQPSVYLKKDVPCWPCSYRECPFEHLCMKSLEVEEVFESCQRFLA